MRALKKEIWPYRVLIKIPETDTVINLVMIDNWCTESIGQRFGEWYGYNIASNSRIYAFKDEATLLVFKLTWGNYGT